MHLDNDCIYSPIPGIFNPPYFYSVYKEFIKSKRFNSSVFTLIITYLENACLIDHHSKLCFHRVIDQLVTSRR